MVIAEHMRAPLLKKPVKMVELLLKTQHGTLPPEDFNACIMADHGSLPPFLAEREKFMAAITAIDGKNAPPELAGANIGVWLKKRQAEAVRELLRLDSKGE